MGNGQGDPPRRVLLKLSGEALAGGKGFGIDPDTAAYLARQVRRFVDSGLGVGMVLGGGNYFRGNGSAALGVRRAAGDSMGMLGTVMNGIIMRETLRASGTPSEVFTPFSIGSFTRLYRLDEVEAMLDEGGVPIFSAGTGHPFFSTDSGAALRAAEIGAELLMKGTKVDGVYDKDPARHADAVRFDRLTLTDALERNLKVMDATAMSLCRDNQISVLVFDLFREENFVSLAGGDRSCGTLVVPE